MGEVSVKIRGINDPQVLDIGVVPLEQFSMPIIRNIESQFLQIALQWSMAVRHAGNKRVKESR